MKRRGMFLIEMAVAGVLLLALTTLCVRYFAVTATQRRALDQRQTALCEAANIMERLTAEPFSELTSEESAKISLLSETQAALPEGELKIDLADEIVGQPSRLPDNAGETPAPQQIENDIKKPAAKRITVTIRWQDRDGQWIEPVRLVAWRYKP